MIPDIRRALLGLLLLAEAACNRMPPGTAMTRSDSAGRPVPQDQAGPAVDTGPGTVTLSPAAQATAAIVVDTARTLERGRVAGWLVVPGQVEADPARVVLVSPRVPGRVERMEAAVGERVRAGEIVALLFSRDFVTAQTDYQLAMRRAASLAGTADSTGARAVAQAARRRLVSIGAAEAEVTRLETGAEVLALLPIRAPYSGSLVEQGAVAGAAVEAGTMLFRLVDLSHVDVVADVPERDIQRLRIGQRAVVTLTAYPGEQFTGVVERIRDELDPTTRTIDAVLHVRNQAGRLRPGMFASVQLGVGGSGDARTTGVAIPESAVLMDGPSRIVFVERSAGTFERREVSIEPIGSPEMTGATARQVLVTAGLTGGERVVVRGAFTLKSELAKAAYAGED